MEEECVCIKQGGSFLVIFFGLVIKFIVVFFLFFDVVVDWWCGVVSVWYGRAEGFPRTPASAPFIWKSTCTFLFFFPRRGRSEEEGGWGGARLTCTCFVVVLDWNCFDMCVSTHVAASTASLLLAFAAPWSRISSGAGSTAFAA